MTICCRDRSSRRRCSSTRRAVDGERHAQVADRMARGDAQPQVPVLDVQLAALVEAAALGEHVAAAITVSVLMSTRP